VVGVSRDDQETNDRFRATLGLPYPILGDPSGSLCESYGVRWPVIGLARRVTYVVGQTKKIRLAFHSEFDAERHATEVCSLVVRA